MDALFTYYKYTSQVHYPDIDDEGKFLALEDVLFYLRDVVDRDSKHSFDISRWEIVKLSSDSGIDCNKLATIGQRVGHLENGKFTYEKFED